MAKRRRKSNDGVPAWAGMLFGLAIGLSVAVAVFFKFRGPISSERTASPPEPASLSEPVQMAANPNLDNNSEATTTEKEEPRFAFYDMLPNFEVVIPEQEPDVAADIEPSAIEDPGVYVLQAGSFSEYADADRRRATLAMHGVESTIQRVTIDDRTYHRVRIGPMRDLNRLNVTRNRLRQAKIDVLRIRLGD